MHIGPRYDRGPISLGAPPDPRSRSPDLQLTNIFLTRLPTLARERCVAFEPTLHFPSMPLRSLPLRRAPRALALASLLACARGPAAPAPASLPAPAAAVPAGVGGPTSAEISERDLRTRLAIYADDSMQGRQAGTEGNLRSTAYIEREVRRLGLQPAGDAGGYFQAVPLVRRQLVAGARLAAGDTALRLWADAWPVDLGPGARDVDGAAVVFGGSTGDVESRLAASAAAGKVVVLAATRDVPLQLVVPRLLRRFPAAAATAIADADAVIATYGDELRGGEVVLAGSMGDVHEGPPVPALLLLAHGATRPVLGTTVADARPGMAGATLHGTIRFERAELPARNVVAVLPGSDPALRGEYVAIGAHSDHLGISRAVDPDSLRAYNQRLHELGAMDPFSPVSASKRASIHVDVDSLRRVRPARRDSVNNGADDDGSGSMAVLELAERYASARERPKRSLLFIWHTGEELGLFGSEWFTTHPTVPLDSIVTELNIDMVGRGSAADIVGGGPGYLQLVGSKRLSKELGAIVEAVNAREPAPLTFDYGMDAAGHPEQIYCRSDHANYARFGIPVTFFTTGNHLDYHQVTDEVQYIDWPHYARVVRFIGDVADTLAGLDHRPALDRAKPDPDAPCRQ